MLLSKPFHHKFFVQDRMKRVVKLRKKETGKHKKHSLTGLVIDIPNSSLNLLASIIN